MNEWYALKANLFLIGNPHDRDRLRRVMLEQAIAQAEVLRAIPLEPHLDIALLTEVAVRHVVAKRHAEFDRPLKGIPHLERALSIENYLASAEYENYLVSTECHQSARLEWLRRTSPARTRVLLLDLCERMGTVEHIEADLDELEQFFARVGELRGEKQALAGIRGAVLGRRGEFAAGEKLLLQRYASLIEAKSFMADSELDARGTASNERPATTDTGGDSAALLDDIPPPGTPLGPNNYCLFEEFLPAETVATVRRLVALYTAWGHPAEAAKWLRELERPQQGRVRLADAWERLVLLYTAWDKPDEALKWFTNLERIIRSRPPSPPEPQVP